MTAPLRALMVEDSADDAELLARELKRAGYNVTYERVDSRSSLEVALARGSWDVVFSDHTMPGFGSQVALKMVRVRDPDLPFIIVSGTMGEDVAVEAMHAGANDYFVKGKLRRLPAALDRELRQAAGRAARRELERAFTALRDVASAVGRLPEPAAVAALSSKHARSLLRADAAVIHAFDADTGLLRPLAHDGMAEGPPIPVRPGQGAAGLTFERREPVVVEDYATWPLALPNFKTTMRSALAVPLLVGDRAIGSLIVMALAPAAFTTDQAELLGLLASEVGPTLEAARLFIQSERERLEAEALAEAAEVVAAGSVARDTFHSILVALQRVVPMSSAFLVVPDDGSASFRVLASVGASGDAVGRAFPLSTGVVGRALHTGAVQLAGDSEPPGPLQIRTGARLSLAVPVLRNDVVTAVLGIAGEARGQVVAREVRLLQRFAALVSTALENDRLLADAAAHAAELERLAHFDLQTQLPNRTLFRDRLQSSLATAANTASPLSVVLVDLDHFKDANDAFGHAVGDEVLRLIGPRLRGALDLREDPARLGGDEFALFLEGADADAACGVAERALLAFERPFVVEDQQLRIRASAGVASYPHDGMDADALLRCAEVAVDEAKRRGSGCETYDVDHDQYAPKRLALMRQLREAIDDGQLLVHYQPILDRARLPTAAEALVRWQHPERGLVGPGEFLPLAERAGLMKALTRWVLAEALGQCRAWHEAGHDLRVAVNLSTRTLHDAELPDMVRELLERSRCDPSWLKLEITESDIMVDVAGATEILRKLRALGVGLSIDDFGTGYSSLAYLHSLDVDQVKIDRSFVARMREDESSAAIVRATIELGHNLGLDVVAEGIEDEVTYALLERLRCDKAQGYLFAPPMSAYDFTAWLRERARGAA